MVAPHHLSLSTGRLLSWARVWAALLVCSARQATGALQDPYGPNPQALCQLTKVWTCSVNVLFSLLLVYSVCCVLFGVCCMLFGVLCVVCTCVHILCAGAGWVWLHLVDFVFFFWPNVRGRLPFLHAESIQSLTILALHFPSSSVRFDLSVWSNTLWHLSLKSIRR